MEKITLFDTASAQTIELYVLEQTTIGEVNYLLAAESDSSESEAWLLKESGQADAETIYEFVEDDAELSAISKVFAEMLEDYDIQL